MWQGVCVAGGMHCGGHVWQGDGGRGGVCVHGGGHVWGACMVGACMARGACMAGGMHGGGYAWHTHPPPHHEVWSVNVQPVRILLECILVNLFHSVLRNSHHSSTGRVIMLVGKLLKTYLEWVALWKLNPRQQKVCIS